VTIPKARSSSAHPRRPAATSSHWAKGVSDHVYEHICWRSRLEEFLRRIDAYAKKNDQNVIHRQNRPLLR
jgi:hypothetical protein